MNLWFFRTPDVHSSGMYGTATRELKGHELQKLDANYWRPDKTPRGITLFCGNKAPAGFPPLKSGECIPVELVPVKAGAKKKKARS